MKARAVEKEELVSRLFKKFGYNEPIFLSEIINAWKEYSRPRVFQLLKEMTEEDMITRDDPGVYYFPTAGIIRKKSVLGRSQIIDKKFICHGEEIYGYYSGLTLLNGLHLTTQMPFHKELVTSRASAKVREVKVNGFTTTVRRSKVKITRKNVHALMLLEAFTDMRRPLEGEEIGFMKEFVELKNIKEETVLIHSRYFPAYTLKYILETGLKNVFTR